MHAPQLEIPSTYAKQAPLILIIIMAVDNWCRLLPCSAYSVNHGIAKHTEKCRIASDSTLAPVPNLKLWDHPTLLVKFMEVTEPEERSQQEM